MLQIAHVNFSTTPKGDILMSKIIAALLLLLASNAYTSENPVIRLRSYHCDMQNGSTAESLVNTEYSGPEQYRTITTSRSTWGGFERDFATSSGEYMYDENGNLNKTFDITLKSIDFNRLYFKIVLPLNVKKKTVQTVKGQLYTASGYSNQDWRLIDNDVACTVTVDN
jgi:hypothetical protein